MQGDVVYSDNKLLLSSFGLEASDFVITMVAATKCSLVRFDYTLLKQLAERRRDLHDAIASLLDPDTHTARETDTVHLRVHQVRYLPACFVPLVQLQEGNSCSGTGAHAILSCGLPAAKRLNAGDKLREMLVCSHGW